MTSSSNPSVLLDLSSKVIEEAEKAVVDVLVTDCVFCRDNLNRAARYKRGKVKVKQLLLLTEKSLNNKNKKRR